MSEQKQHYADLSPFDRCVVDTQSKVTGISGSNAGRYPALLAADGEVLLAIKPLAQIKADATNDQNNYCHALYPASQGGERTPHRR